jgi:hypothetical protein
MTDAEKRQAKRIIRNLRAIEQRIFSLIEALQAGQEYTDEHYPWDDAFHEMQLIAGGLPVVCDLIRNIQAHLSHPTDFRP